MFHIFIFCRRQRRRRRRGVGVGAARAPICREGDSPSRRGSSRPRRDPRVVEHLLRHQPRVLLLSSSSLLRRLYPTNDWVFRVELQLRGVLKFVQFLSSRVVRHHGEHHAIPPHRLGLVTDQQAGEPTRRVLDLTPVTRPGRASSANHWHNFSISCSPRTRRHSSRPPHLVAIFLLRLLLPPSSFLSPSSSTSSSMSATSTDTRSYPVSSHVPHHELVHVRIRTIPRNPSHA